MKKITITLLSLLFVVSNLTANSTPEITRRLDMMEQQIALTTSERATIEPIMQEYKAEVAKIKNPKKAKEYYGEYLQRIYKVIGQGRMQRAMAYEKGDKQPLTPQMERKLEVMDQEIQLTAEEREALSNIMLKYHYDRMDCLSLNLDVKPKWQEFVNGFIKVLGEDRYKRGWAKAKDVK